MRSAVTEIEDIENTKLFTCKVPALLDDMNGHHDHDRRDTRHDVYRRTYARDCTFPLLHAKYVTPKIMKSNYNGQSYEVEANNFSKCGQPLMTTKHKTRATNPVMSRLLRQTGPTCAKTKTKSQNIAKQTEWTHENR